MICAEGRTDDVDEVRHNISQGSWEADVLQLSPGPLRHESRAVRLPGLDVLCLRYGAQTLEIQETKGDDRVSLGLILEATTPMRMNGAGVAPGRIIGRAKGDQDAFLITPGTTSVNVNVDPELVGGRRGLLGVVAAPEPLRRDLVASCHSLVDTCRRAAGDPPEAPLAAARARVIDAVRALVAGDLQPDVDRAADRERFDVVQRARRRLQETQGAVPIPRLARQLAVSERTLFRAFKQCLGLAPQEVEQLRRLHEFRARLVARGPGRGRVAEAAAEAGFGHLGRLSGLYRAHFGERPSETLRRNGSGTAAE